MSARETARVHDLTEALEDSAALVDVATAAGVSTSEARRVAAGLAALPIRRMLRICFAAWRQEQR